MTHNNVTRPSGLVMIVRDYVASALPQQQLAVPATSTCPLSNPTLAKQDEHLSTTPLALPQHQ